MKYKLLVVLTLLICGTVQSQSSDTLPPYLQFKIIPPFKIQLMDSTTWFTKGALSSKKPTWIIYFSPDCGHCQLETEEIISNIKALQKVQIVMVASRPFPDVKNFYDHYLLQRFPNIILGVDQSRLVVNYYRVEYTPFSALYDKRGKLIKAFKDAPKIEEVISLVK
jgi:thiol-disulfide isomerase/thioredoxin